MKADFERLLDAALERRAALLGSHEALRVFDGPGDGIPGFYLDRFGSLLLAHVFAEFDAASFDARLAAVAAERTRAATVYLRRHETDARGTSERPPALVFGAPLEETVVREESLSFLVRPLRNVNAGLFLDTRLLRRRLRSAAKAKRVLNTFAFTGSLGVAAYVGGALEVTQSDISKGVLAWARENFERNKAAGIGSMRFIAEDSRSFMQREARRIAKGRAAYDLVIIDAPAYGSGDKKTFSFERDLESLLADALSVLTRPGTLVVCGNVRELSAAEIESRVRDAASAAGRGIRSAELLGPPSEDFTAKLSESSAMRGVWVEIE